MFSLWLVFIQLKLQAIPIERKHRLQYFKRDQVDLPYWYPPAKFITLDGAEATHSLLEQALVATAKTAVVKHFGFAPENWHIVHEFTDQNSITHLYFQRHVNGVGVDNQRATVHMQGGQVTALSSSVSEQALAKRSATTMEALALISEEQAVANAEALLGAKRDSQPMRYAYIEIPDGTLVYAYRFQVRNDAKKLWFDVSVDTHTGQIVHVTDFWNRWSPSDGTYRTIVLPNSNPQQGFGLAVNPAYLPSSPHGWHSNGTHVWHTTIGNNADVSIGESNLPFPIPGQPVAKVYRPRPTYDMFFDSHWDPNKEPGALENQRASTVCLFYVVNVLHDIFYQYGFNEAAGNFQQNNFGKGGLGNDPLKVHSQNDLFKNDAQFATPPDGQSPVMDMFLFNSVSPERDGSLDFMIPIHEFIHGVTKRLSGGSHNGFCLNGIEPSGMSEGWGDAIAIFLTRGLSDTRQSIISFANYVIGGKENGHGIRPLPYSSDTTAFPDRYSSIKKYGSQQYPIGSIWANMLLEMYWNLVERAGFSDNWYDSMQEIGNIIALRLVLQGVMLQPCNPTFMQARDAILAADKLLYRERYHCEVWRAFAKWGLGQDAVQEGYVDGYSVPPQCSL